MSDINSKKIAIRSGKKRAITAIGLFGAFALGGLVTATALQHHQPVLLTLAPGPIGSMHDWSPVAIKGQVVEIFGNKFIIQDDSGRALVEIGPKGDGAPLVSKSETVTVQGRFEHGFIHAQMISHRDGRNEAVGPGGPHDHQPIANNKPAISSPRIP